MSIRIQSDMIGSSDAASHAEQVRGTSGNAAGRVCNAEGSGQDSVNLSAGTRSITSALACTGATRAERVQALLAAYQSGRHQVDSVQVSRSLIGGSIRTSSLD